jgi:hypothetical protein
MQGRRKQIEIRGESCASMAFDIDMATQKGHFTLARP